MIAGVCTLSSWSRFEVGDLAESVDSAICSAGAYEDDYRLLCDFYYDLLDDMLDGDAVVLDLPSAICRAVICYSELVFMHGGHGGWCAKIRSEGTVILMLSCDPSTSLTLLPTSSARETSSVTVMFMELVHGQSPLPRDFLATWGVCISHSVVRSGVFLTWRPLSTCLIVYRTGTPYGGRTNVSLLPLWSLQ